MSGIRYQKFFKEEGGSEGQCRIENLENISTSSLNQSWRQTSIDRIKEDENCPRTPLLDNSESEEDVDIECGDVEQAEDSSRENTEQDPVQYPDEPCKTLLMGVFLGIGFIVTTIGLVLAHERLPEGPPLPDVILDNVRYLEWGLTVSEYIMMSSTIAAFLLVLLHTHRMIIFRRIFFIMGVMYYYRALTFSVTVLPKSDANYHCDAKYNGSLPLEELFWRVVKVSAGGGLSINHNQVYCGDFIFSGHTMVLTASYLTITEYSPKQFFLLHWASAIMSVSGVVFLLIGRGHYTVDVVIAYMITTRLWYLYHTLANTTIKTGGRGNSFRKLWWWRVFSWLESNVPGPLPYRYSLPLPLVMRLFLRKNISRLFGKKEKVETLEQA